MCLASPLIFNGTIDATGIRQVTDRLDAYNLERDHDGEEILEAEVFGRTSRFEKSTSH